MALRTRRLFPFEFGPYWRTLAPQIDASVKYHGKMDPEHTVGTMLPLLESVRAVAFLLYDDERPTTCAGMLFGFIAPNMFTGALEGLEGGWFVAPCVRRRNSALLLLKAFEEFAKTAGCIRVLSGSTISHRAGAMSRLYRRLGYQPHAEAFSKEL
jgi:GNAT superfamily N-acetyltransferase